MIRLGRANGGAQYRSCLSHLDQNAHIVKLEEKSQLTEADPQVAQSIIEKIQALSDTFKEEQFVIPDQAGDAAIIVEQEVFDEHDNKVFLDTTEPCQLLEGLEFTTLSIPPWIVCSICTEQCAKKCGRWIKSCQELKMLRAWRLTLA